MRTVLCFGDSNTHGTPADGSGVRLGPGERWPGVLAGRLGAGWRVIEEGLPGRTTVHSDPVEGAHLNGLLALPMLLGSHRPLDHVVIMLGTNDLKTRLSVTPWDVALGLERLVTVVRQGPQAPYGRAADGGEAYGGAPGVTLVSPPRLEEVGELALIFRGAANKSRGLAEAVAAIAARADCGFLDAAAIVEPGEDGVHFGADAHRGLGEAVADALPTAA